MTAAFRNFYFGLLGILLVAGILHAERHFIDYPVYELAGKKVLTGHSLDLYDLPGAGADGFYYAYVFALLFVPLALMGGMGKIFLALFFACYLKTLRFSERMALHHVGPVASTPTRYALLSALVLLTSYAANDAFMNANIGLFLLALGIAAFEQREERPVLSGFLLGMAIAFKTYPVILLGFFVWERRWRVAVYSVITALFLVFAVPLLVTGFATGALILRRYLYLISHFQELWGARGWHFGGHVFQNIHGTFIRYSSLFGESPRKAYLVSAFASSLIVVLFFLKSFLTPVSHFTVEFREKMFCLTLAIVPMIVPISWYNMALFYTPMIAMLAARAMFRRDRLAAAVLGIYVLLYCLTTPDLIGRPLNQRLCFYAIPWIGIVALFFAYVRELVRSAPNLFFRLPHGRGA